MGYLRLYKRVRVAPGVTLNLSRSGLSTSVGPRGAKVTLGSRGVRTTVGIPGTGIYYTDLHHSTRPAAARGQRNAAEMVTPTERLAATRAAQRLSSQVRLKTGPGVLLAWGIACALVGIITIPTVFGPILFGAVAATLVLVWNQRRRQAEWIALGLVRRSRTSRDAVEIHSLLHEALNLDAKCGAAMFELAQRCFGDGVFADAAVYFSEYLDTRPPNDLYAKERLADSLLRSGEVEKAKSALLDLRADPAMLAETSSITAKLAWAFVLEGNHQQATELCSCAIGAKRNLDDGQMQCLRIRASARFISGRRAEALHDIDRLFALNPFFPGLGDDRRRMADGTYTVDSYTHTGVSDTCAGCGAPVARGATTCRYCQGPAREANA